MLSLQGVRVPGIHPGSARASIEVGLSAASKWRHSGESNGLIAAPACELEALCANSKKGPAGAAC